MPRRSLARLESALDRVFTPQSNPLYQLGALGWFFYWIVTVTGIYLYIFFDTGIQDAYQSVEAITFGQPYAGGVMRSLHRYACDALIVVVMAHLLREYVRGRFRGPRWFAWFTGIPLLWLLFAAGVGGYWLVWDKLAQYVAIGVTEWLDALPLFGEPIARNFLRPASLSDRFFTLVVFIHIAVPLLMLFVMWVHIQRLSRPQVNPPRSLAAGTLLALTVLALGKPALSQGPADLAFVPFEVGLDWFYLAFLPLREVTSDLTVWAAAAGASALLMAIPWLRRRTRLVPAVVHLEHCNGCGRCAADCPYSAITMVPRSDDQPYSAEARVKTELCVACGICTGACPTATPFVRRGSLVPGIELPALPVAGLRERLLEATARLAADVPRIVIFGCEHGAGAAADSSTAVLPLPCVGMLPPSFIDFLITRRHTDGVVLAACRSEGCYHRLGSRWTSQRIAGERDPYLRVRVPRERVALIHCGIDQAGALAQAIAQLRARLDSLGPYLRPKPPGAPPSPGWVPDPLANEAASDD